jgi:hypothetical protein
MPLVLDHVYLLSDPRTFGRPYAQNIWLIIWRRERWCLPRRELSKWLYCKLWLRSGKFIAWLNTPILGRIYGFADITTIPHRTARILLL